MPNDRCALRSSIFGPSAAAHRASRGTGTAALSRPSKKSRIVDSGSEYSPVASGWPMPIPSSRRPGNSQASCAHSVASSDGSYCHTLTMPVATISRSVASKSGRTVGSRGDPPSQSVPYPRSSTNLAASPAFSSPIAR